MSFSVFKNFSSTAPAPIWDQDCSLLNLLAFLHVFLFFVLLVLEALSQGLAGRLGTTIAPRRCEAKNCLGNMSKAICCIGSESELMQTGFFLSTYFHKNFPSRSLLISLFESWTMWKAESRLVVPFTHEGDSL